MRVRMIDNITGKVVRVAKQFSKAAANAPKTVASVAKTGTIARKRLLWELQQLVLSQAV